MQLGKVSDEDSVKEIQQVTNESYQMLYMNSIVSSVMKLHDFINNKIEIKFKESQSQQIPETAK